MKLTRRLSRGGLRSLILAIFCLIVGKATSQPIARLNDDDLYQAAFASYGQADWPTAAALLYAYIQRGAADYISDPQRATAVNTCFSYAQGMVTAAFTDR